MKKILLVLQIFIKCSLIFLVFFVWLNFVFDSLWLSAVISFVITFVIEVVSNFIKRKKGDIDSLKIKEKENAEKMFYSLSKDNGNIEFFYNLARSRHQNVKKNKKFILICHQDNTKVALFPFLKFQTMTIDDLLSISHLIKVSINKLVIVCNLYDKTLSKNLSDFPYEIVLLNKYETYQKLYKEYDFYPTITVKESQSKFTFKDFINNAFRREKAKAYLISSLALFIGGIFIQFNIYYNIVASILMLFAIISLSNKSNKKLPDEVL